MSLKKDLTIIFVSFYSKNLIEKPISQINNDIPIIVVENSLDVSLKKKLESKYPNVTVIIPDENTGNGGGANIGLRLVKTKYASLPNILADKPLVKELLLEDCTPEQLSEEVQRLLSSDNKELLAAFSQMHHLIRKDADLHASQAVLKLIGK